MSNVVNTLAHSFLIGSFSFSQVIRTIRKSRMILKFGQIRPWITDEAALECFFFKKNPHRLTLTYGVYIPHFLKFARVCSHIEDLNARNKCLTAKPLKQVS